ncbi:MAG: metalloregulator ArsR/SmtB family transcription factor [Candidatus Saccharibacteria bacterium]|nr:metalloregulator ArsR/SmtB family transcription factor [Candidatus Saccharibacteria bacterium]
MYEKLFELQEDVFKVIANQKRLEIIQLLTHKEMSVSEMVSMLGISQSNVSQHLSLLRQVGIVSTRKTGTSVYYSLKDERIAEACSLIRKFLANQNKLSNLSFQDTDLESLYPLVQDPVCGMRMGVTEASEQVTHGKDTYFFCASGCKHTFEKNPKQYIKHKTSRGA